MTYKETYLNCKTPDELKEVVENDAKTASWLNPDRIKIIEKAMNEVCVEKNWVL